jgi:hypothetical protein
MKTDLHTLQTVLVHILGCFLAEGLKGFFKLGYVALVFLLLRACCVDPACISMSHFIYANNSSLRNEAEAKNR